MSPLAAPNSKTYIDRAVQTDQVAIASSSRPGFTIDISDTSTCFVPALKTFSALENESTEDIPTESTAYMHSQRSLLDGPVDIFPARKDRKLVSLVSGLGHPSTRTPTPRVVSLPESSSASDATRIALVEQQTRVVSMPERGKLSNLVSVSEHTATTVNVGAGNATRSYPSDVPQTPSPPSSPESVMIIGNDGQVSGSFLQNRPRSFMDDDGWVTWASSPPRPIPALHGPLSLPYARCPSGAEGTVIEGNDLSHKIWGLGADDNPTHTRHHRPPTHTVPPPAQTSQSPEIKAHTLGDPYQASAHQRRRDTVIDLSQPSTFDHMQNEAQRRASCPAIPAQRVSAPLDASNFSDIASSALAKLASLPHIRQHDRAEAAKKAYSSATAPDQLGLALQWERLFNSDPQAKLWLNNTKSVGAGQGTENRLNSSAAPFVPQHYVSPSLLDRAILQEKSQFARAEQAKAGYRTSTSDRLSSSTHHWQDHNAQSPPSTASPLWTPIFTQAADMQYAHNKSLGSRAGQHMPDIYSPELDRGGYQQLDPLVNAHSIAQRQSEFHGLAHNGLDKEKYSSQITLGNVNAYTRQEGHRLPPIIDIHQGQQPPIDFEASHQEDRGQQAVDRRRSLTHQHPRSIPLARLIQRRLSAVVEEDVLPSNLNYDFGDDHGGQTTSSSHLIRQLPSGAPMRLFAQRSRSKMGAYGDEFERKSGFGGAGRVSMSQDPSTVMMMGGVGGASGGGGKLQPLNVKDDPKAVVKLPTPRMDAPRAASNRLMGSNALFAREPVPKLKPSHGDPLPVEEKENNAANANRESVNAATGNSGKTPKKNYKHRKRSERASGVSKADCST